MRSRGLKAAFSKGTQGIVFMKMLCNISLAAVLMLGATAAHAQDGTVTSGGCSQSPENPTIVLSLLGVSGFAVAATRDRLRNRFGKRTRD